MGQLLRDTQYQPNPPKNYSDYYTRDTSRTYKRPPTDVRQYTFDKYYYHNPNISPYLNLARHNRYGNNYYQRVLPEQQRREAANYPARSKPVYYGPSADGRCRQCGTGPLGRTYAGLHRHPGPEVVRKLVPQEFLRPIVANRRTGGSSRQVRYPMTSSVLQVDLLHACPVMIVSMPVSAVVNGPRSSNGSCTGCYADLAWCMIDLF